MVENENKLGSEPAFPVDRDRINMNCTGISKREYFAGLAMQGLLAGLNNQSFESLELIASSVRIADELLSKLNTNSHE